MADITGGAVPGLDTKSILKQMQGAPEAFAAEVKPYQDQLAASTAKIEEMRKKQAAERAPIVQQIRSKSAEPGMEYKPGDLPDFKPPQIDPKEMNETMSLLTAVAAMSGLLTRQPLTAALNAFSQGVHGYVQGNQEQYKRSLDTFKTSFEKAKTLNDEHYKQVQQAQAKHKNDIQGLMNELSVLSAEHQDAVQSAMLARGDLTSAISISEKKYDAFQKISLGVAKLAQSEEHAKQAHADRRAALDKRGWQVFQGPDGKLTRVNLTTGKVEPIEGSEGLTKLGGAKAAGGAGHGSSPTAQRFTDSVISSANQITKDLGNVMHLPITSKSGFFGTNKTVNGITDIPVRALGLQVTSETARQYETIVNGLGKNLANLMTQGRVSSDKLMAVFDNLKFQDKDTINVMLTKLAQARQEADASLDVMKSSPVASEKTIETINKIQEELKQNIPFTVADVIKLGKLGPAVGDRTIGEVATAALESQQSSGPAQSQRPSSAPPEAKQAPDGHWYAPDPTRPGKYVRYD